LYIDSIKLEEVPVALQHSSRAVEDPRFIT